MKRARILIVLALLLIAGGVYYFTAVRPRDIVLTGIVTTDEVIVSSRIQGLLEQLNVKEGDLVTKNELLAQIDPQEWEADLDYYKSAEQVAVAQLAQASADQENARLNYERQANLLKTDVASQQDYDQARTSYDSVNARVDSLQRQIFANRAQKEKSQVELGYTQIRAPIDGVVDTRAALQGEVVNPGQPLVTLVDQDDLWVRADVEETYIDGIRLGDVLTVRFPSGAMRKGTVYYRGVDADYATQRDVSRTKRDIKTFEIRLRCDNRDRALALGMTAYVLLPIGKS
ncbi:MAG: efflux RND transporter periplasmic adaptor subunit [Chthoniobacteraceae bacterium]|jgi:RND family efflux transporter MFP subunit